MTQLSSREYFTMRQRKSAEMARAAIDPSVARVHQEFADRYAARLEPHAVIANG